MEIIHTFTIVLWRIMGPVFTNCSAEQKKTRNKKQNKKTKQKKGQKEREKEKAQLKKIDP